MSKSTLYLKDKTLDQDQKKETRNKIIIGSAVVAGSIFAYKSGALRPMVNLGISMLERSKGAVASTGAFVNWFNSEGQEGSGSVLRKSIGDTAKNIINAKISGDDINISINKDNLNKIIKDTKADFFDLKDRVASAKRSAHNNGKSIMSSLFNTDMMKDINDSDHSTKHYSQNHRRAKEVINYKTKQDLIRSGRLSQKDIDKQLKRMGMRNLTIEDIFDFDYDSYGDGRVKLTVKSGRKNSEFGTDSDLNKLIGKLEGTLNAKAYSDGGTRLMKDNKGMFLHQTESSFGKMKVDSSLFINGKGKITDLRGTKRGFNSMLRGAANNWKIPIININPLKMAGLGNIGTNRNVKYATIGETQVAPFLTGVSGTGKDKTIAALKKTQGHLSGIKEGVTLINGDVYRIDDSGRGITKMAYETKKRVSYVSGYGSKNHNYGGKLNSYVRTMAGASKTRYEEHTNGKENKFWRRMMRKLDIGYQDTNRKTFNTAADYINPDNYVRALTKKLIPKAWNKSKTEGLYTFTNPMSNDVNKGSYFVSNQSVRIRDIFANVKPGGADLKNVKNRADLKNELSKINVNWRGAGKAMSGYVRQFGAGFDGGKNSFEYVNKKTALAFSPFKMVNDKLSNLGLGLSASSSRSSWDLAKNLLLKRALPAYALYRGWDLINMLGEKDRSRKATTVNQVLWEQVAATDIGFHTMSSKIGLNKFASGAKALMPGSNTMFRNIGVGGFRMDQNADERLDYWENGYDPVRKNRFMTLSSGPMGGGSIEYFRANPYRRALADAKYSEQGYGSRAERLANTLNPYHYDKKHYYDRPYLQTSGAFGSVPIVGGMLQGTIGRLVKPVKKMHSEYWKGPFNSRPLNSIEAMRKEMKSEYGYGGMTYIQSLNSLSKVGNFRDSMSRQYDMERASGLLRFYGSKKGSDNFIYRTPSGYMNRAQVGNNFTQYNVNNGMTLSRAGGSTRQVLGNEIDREAIRQYRLGKISKPSAFSSFSQFKKSTGMYGFMGDFMAQPVYSGRAKRTVIESSNYRSMRQSFDDMRLGNLGGDFNMLARRTLQGRRNDTNYYNPIRNRMSDWMPGRNGFIDFQHGDVYAKVANGLERLPGEGFERLNNIDFNEELKLKLDASNIGKSKNELVRHWTKEDTIDAAGGRNIAANRLIKQSLMNNGVGIDSNVEISDNNKISGTYDLRINDSSSSTGQGIVNIRAVDAENFKKIYKTGSANKEDVAQVNWLLGATNPNHKGYVMYVNRENPGQQHTIGFNYDENMNRQNVQNVLTARKEVINKLNTGDIKRGDFYSYVNRLKVLADVAPYSEEYQAMSSTVSNMKLSQAEQEEVRKIRARVKEQKKSNNEMFGYKFRDAKVQSSRTRLGKHIGRGSFTIKGYGDALKLSGIDIITTDNPKYAEAQEFLRKNVENNAVKILIEKENHRRRNKDMQDSVKAVVYSNGMNINKEMVKRGYATWKEDDNSSTATYARFNRGQRAFGRAWERFAHMDTLAHTKLLNVRSAAEAYERDEVYGRKRKSWTRPVRDYVKPFLWKNSQRGLLGLAIGGAVGSMFAGKGAGRFGKLAAATIGAGLVGATQAQAARSPKGKAWIPKEKQQIRDINQYMDKLKYVKHKRLFELYSAKAQKYDKVDVKKALIDSRKQGNKDKRSKRHLKQMKAHYSRYGKIRRSDMKKAGIKLQKGEGFFSRLGSAVFKNFKRSGYSEGLNGELQFRLGGPLSSKNILDNMSKSRKERDAAIMKRVNGDYTALMNKRELTKGSQNAIKAIEHYNEAKKTMHAFEPGDNMKLAMEALPKKDRAYFKEFMNASGRERKQIMKYAPDYMKRQLQSAWGQKVDEADNLSDYFSQHALPDNNWEGWNEGYDLNSIKTKMAITNNIDLGDLDLYEDDKAKAEMYGNTDIPNIYHQNKNSRYIKSQLKDIMGSANFYDVDVNISYIKGKSSVNLDIEEKKEERFKKKLDKRLRDLR